MSMDGLVCPDCHVREDRCICEGEPPVAMQESKKERCPACLFPKDTCVCYMPPADRADEVTARAKAERAGRDLTDAERYVLQNTKPTSLSGAPPPLFDLDAARFENIRHVKPPTRKQLPVASGVIDYFPDAIMEVALVSWTGNEQHHPGTPLHWDRSKSTDEADALMRHFVQRGTRDTDEMRHSAKVAWRALALLQKEIEAERTEVRK